MNYVNLAANDYIYGENEQKTYVTTNFEGTLCNFRFVLENPYGIGWYPDHGIGITVDGVDYGLLALPYGVGNYYAEKIITLPSGEIQLSWIGVFDLDFNHFEVYNSSEELIYTCLNYLEGLFFTYQNECVECLPITGFEGVYFPEEHQVKLSWEVPESAGLIGFDILRNNGLIDHVSPSTISYSENTEELETGDYKYCVVPVYPSICTLDEKCFESYISNVGIINYKDNITVHPNPATNFINITGDRVSTIKMYNNIGQLILTQQNTNTINVSTLTDGIYLLTIETSTGQITQKKIIINH